MSADDQQQSEIQDSIIDNEPVTRSDFLKKVVAGGVISVAAISGVGALQKAFGQGVTGGGNPSIGDLITQVQTLTKQLNTLQGQFADLISGKLQASELSTIKLDFNAMQSSDFQYLKLKQANSDDYFLKLDGIDGLSIKKLSTEDLTSHKGMVADFVADKWHSSDFQYIKLQQANSDGYLLKLDGIDGLSIKKLNTQDFTSHKGMVDSFVAQDVSALKIETADITFQKAKTALDQSDTTT